MSEICLKRLRRMRKRQFVADGRESLAVVMRTAWRFSLSAGFGGLCARGFEDTRYLI